MLKEFNITSTTAKSDRVYIKKNGEEMQEVYIVIHTNSINLYNLISKIGFRFNSKRRKLAEEALKIVYPIQLEEIRKVGAYKKVSELRKKGKTLKEISSILNLPIWNIKSWIYKKRKPRLYNYIKKINNS
jgi:hypothetical protein